MSNQRRLLAMASEWATELGKICGPGQEFLVAEVAAWGFQEVEKGRHPDAVLKDMIRQIRDNLPPPGEPNAGNEDRDPVDPQRPKPPGVRNGEG